MTEPIAKPFLGFENLWTQLHGLMLYKLQRWVVPTTVRTNEYVMSSDKKECHKKLFWSPEHFVIVKHACILSIPGLSNPKMV